MSGNFMPFGEFVEIQPHVALEKGKEYDFVAMESVQPNQRNIERASRRLWSGSGGARFQDGDTVFARITPCLENGKTALVSGLESRTGFGSTEFYVFRAKPNVSDARYIYYLARSEIVREPAIKSMVGSSGRQRVKQEALENIKVPRLTTSVQSEIAGVLSAYDDLIENNRRRIALLEEAARLLYREWFVHFRFPGHEHATFVDGLPEGWQRVKLADAFDTTSGGTPSRAHSEYFEGNINWVKTQELNELPIFQTDERITEDALQASAAKLFPADTLLVSIYGGTNIGRTGILAEPAASNQACVALFPKRRKEDWIYAQLWLQHARAYIVGIAQGAAQTNISQQTLRGLEMVWPKASLLDDFIEAVHCQYEQIKCLCQQNQKLAQARDLLLPRLMSGMLAV